MKYGAISVKYILYFLKIIWNINMKVGGVETHIYIKGLLSPFCLKNLRNTKQVFVEFWKLSRMIENGLSK
jgi:hypothetical protein